MECTDLVGWPIRGGQAWSKNLSISKGMLRRFNWSMAIALDGAHVRYIGCCVCSWGAKCIGLVEWPICGGQTWLKNLSIYEGILRRFNWSMVIGTCLWPRSYIVRSVCSWGEVH